MPYGNCEFSKNIADLLQCSCWTPSFNPLISEGFYSLFECHFSHPSGINTAHFVAHDSIKRCSEALMYGTGPDMCTLKHTITSPGYFDKAGIDMHPFWRLIHFINILIKELINFAYEKGDANGQRLSSALDSITPHINYLPNNL